MPCAYVHTRGDDTIATSHLSCDIPNTILIIIPKTKSKEISPETRALPQNDQLYMNSIPRIPSPENACGRSLQPDQHSQLTGPSRSTCTRKRAQEAAWRYRSAVQKVHCLGATARKWRRPLAGLRMQLPGSGEPATEKICVLVSEGWGKGSGRGGGWAESLMPFDGGKFIQVWRLKLRCNACMHVGDAGLDWVPWELWGCEAA